MENLPAYKAKNRWLDQPKVVNGAGEAFQEAAEAESEIDDARVKVSFDDAQEDASVQDIARVLDMLLDAKVQARKKTLTTVVKSVNVVSCADVEEDLQNLIDEDSVDAQASPKTNEVDRSHVTSSAIGAGVLTTRANPP